MRYILLNSFSREKGILLLEILLVLSLAAFLRFYGLTKQSLWNDELSSWNRSNYEHLSEVIEKGAKTDVHPPAYHVVLYFVERFAGDSEAMLRFPSALAGVLSVFVIFLFGRLLYSNKEGIIASLFMAVLWCPIYYSQEARSYSLLLLFSLLASYFWIKLVRRLRAGKYNSWGIALGCALSSIITSYLHYFGLYFIALQGLLGFLLLIKKPKSLVYITGLYVFVVLAYMPWVPIMILHFTKEADWIPPPEEMAFCSYLKFLFNESALFMKVVLCFYVYLCLSTFYKFIRSDVKNLRSAIASSGFVLTIWLIIPFFIVFIISISGKSILTNRNLIISLPAAYLLLARSITQLPLKGIKQGILVAVLAIMFLYNLFFEFEYYSQPHKQQFRDAVAYVVDQDVNYENSMIIGYAWHSNYLNYYFKKLGSKRKLDLPAGQKENITITEERIKKRKPNYIWFVSAHRVPESEYLDYLNQNYTLLICKSFINANVWLYEVVP